MQGCVVKDRLFRALFLGPNCNRSNCTEANCPGSNGPGRLYVRAFKQSRVVEGFLVSFPNAKYWKILVGVRKAIHVMIICVTKAYVLSVWCIDYKTYRYEFGINTQKNTIDE